MSLYDLCCQSCDHTFIYEKKMLDPYPPCPRCGGETRRIINEVPSVHYSGGGFYSTDKKEPPRDKKGKLKDVLEE